MTDKEGMFPPVIVTWMDAWGEDEGSSLDRVEHAPYETDTIGFLVISDEVGVTISMDRYPADPKNLRNHAFIPRGMITEVKFLTEVDSPTASRTQQPRLIP